MNSSMKRSFFISLNVFLVVNLIDSEIIYLTPKNVEDVLSNLEFPELREERSKPFTFFVEGIIGTGKSTLLRFFKNYQYMDILPEPVDKWTNLNGTDVLKLLYDDPARWGLTQESLVQMAMVEEHSRNLGLVKGMERSVHSSRFIFAENLKKHITEMEYGLIDGWYKMLTNNIDTLGDLIIYLQTDPNAAIERVKTRGRPEEKNLTINFLNDLHRLHEDWLIHRNFTAPGIFVPAPRVMVINTNHSLPDMIRMYTLLSNKIRKSIPATKKIWCHFSKT